MRGKSGWKVAPQPAKAKAPAPAKAAAAPKHPAVMIMIGIGKPPRGGKAAADPDDAKPSMRGKVPGFNGKTRRTYKGP